MYKKELMKLEIINLIFIDSFLKTIKLVQNIISFRLKHMSS